MENVDNIAVPLTLSLGDVKAVLSGLNNLPHGQVRGLFDHITAQTNAHLARVQAPPVAESEVAEEGGDVDGDEA